MSLQRLRTDFRFAIVTLFGTIAVLCIVPFAVYRFAAGQPLAGALDLAIVTCIIAGMVHAWRGGDLEHAGVAVVATSAVGCLAVIGTVGGTGVPWIYVLLLANFLLVGRRKAVIGSGLMIAAVAWQGSAFDSPLQMLVFVMTALVVSLFAFVFAHRTETQRLRLEALAAHDPLTGAFNRRAMEHELQVAVATMRRNHAPVGLAVLDLDHFKRINDSYGHEAGDRVLVEFARLVVAATRKGDRLFRFGGEEFVLLLPGADAGALRMLSELLRTTVASQLRCQDEVVSVSIGAAALAPGEDVAAWLARADAAMYRAKHEGRDRVVVAETMAAATGGEVQAVASEAALPQ